MLQIIRFKCEIKLFQRENKERERSSIKAGSSLMNRSWFQREDSPSSEAEPFWCVLSSHRGEEIRRVKVHFSHLQSGITFCYEGQSRIKTQEQRHTKIWEICWTTFFGTCYVLSKPILFSESKAKFASSYFLCAMNKN